MSASELRICAFSILSQLERSGRAVTWRKCFRLSARGNCQAGKPASSDTFRKRFFRRDYFRRVKTASSITVTLSKEIGERETVQCLSKSRMYGACGMRQDSPPIAAGMDEGYELDGRCQEVGL